MPRAGVASGGGAGKAKELGKADAKAEPAKDGKESKDADALTRGAAEAPSPADKSVEPRRKVLLHLVEVLYVPGTQPAPDALKK